VLCTIPFTAANYPSITIPPPIHIPSRNAMTYSRRFTLPSSSFAQDITNPKKTDSSHTGLHTHTALALLLHNQWNTRQVIHFYSFLLSRISHPRIWCLVLPFRRYPLSSGMSNSRTFFDRTRTITLIRPNRGAPPLGGFVGWRQPKITLRSSPRYMSYSRSTPRPPPHDPLYDHVLLSSFTTSIGIFTARGDPKLYRLHYPFLVYPLRTSSPPPSGLHDRQNVLSGRATPHRVEGTERNIQSSPSVAQPRGGRDPQVYLPLISLLLSIDVFIRQNDVSFTQTRLHPNLPRTRPYVQYILFIYSSR